jgi:DNA-directed RNA polymerase specialized sigma24 family protein
VRIDQFERLYEEHAQGVFGFLVFRTGDAALAEGLVADIFEQVLAARRPRRAGEKTWIYATARASP